MAGAIQKAANSSGTPEPTEFVYGRDEVPLQHFHRRLAEDLSADGLAADPLTTLRSMRP